MNLMDINSETKKITVSTSSQTVDIPKGSKTVRVVSNTSAICFVKAGGSTASAASTDTPILPSSVEVFTIDQQFTKMALIAPSGAGDVYFQFGQGA